MKPEASEQAIFNGQPRLVRTKRVARFFIDNVRARMALKPVAEDEATSSKKHRLGQEIERRGRDFTSMLRATWGENLKTGLILRPKLPGRPYAVAVGAIAEDTPRQHRTTALMDIRSGEGHITRLLIKGIEPTRAAVREQGEASPRVYVRVVDPDEPDREYDSRDYHPEEQASLEEITGQVMNDVTRACDQGSVEVFERAA